MITPKLTLVTAVCLLASTAAGAPTKAARSPDGSLNNSTVSSPSTSPSSAASGAPTSSPSFPPGMGPGPSDTNAYDCGCASKKQALVDAGAGTFEIAVTMMETGSDMSGSSYPLGDGKTEDSANFGPFKNNWYAIRTACSDFAGLTADDWTKGVALNNDNAAAVKCIQEQRQYFGQQGQTAWFGVQRDGASGAANPGSSDIQAYGNAVTAIQAYVAEGHLTDDMATYYNVPGI